MINKSSGSPRTGLCRNGSLYNNGAAALAGTTSANAAIRKATSVKTRLAMNMRNFLIVGIVRIVSSWSKRITTAVCNGLRGVQHDESADLEWNGERTCGAQIGEKSPVRLPLCAHHDFAFGGDAAGNVAPCEDDRLKKYDPSDTVVLDMVKPFAFTPNSVPLTAAGDVHAAGQPDAEVQMARADSSGTLLWSKSFPNTIPPYKLKPIELAVKGIDDSRRYG